MNEEIIMRSHIKSIVSDINQRKCSGACNVALVRCLVRCKGVYIVHRLEGKDLRVGDFVEHVVALDRRNILGVFIATTLHSKSEGQRS